MAGWWVVCDKINFNSHFVTKSKGPIIKVLEPAYKLLAESIYFSFLGFKWK